MDPEVAGLERTFFDELRNGSDLRPKTFFEDTRQPEPERYEMQLLNNPLAQPIAKALSNIAPGGVLDDALELIGITNPEKLGEVLSADSVGDVTEAVADSYGFEPEIAVALGVAADASTGNVEGAASNAVEELGGEEATSALELAGRLGV